MGPLVGRRVGGGVEGAVHAHGLKARAVRDDTIARLPRGEGQAPVREINLCHSPGGEVASETCVESTGGKVEAQVQVFSSIEMSVWVGESTSGFG